MVSEKIGGTRYSFAQPMYTMLASIGFEFKSPEWAGLKETPIPGLDKSPRQMLQTLGTEWGRNQVCADFWIMMADLRLVNGTKLIISDVRFENEATWVRKNGILLHVTRPDTLGVSPHTSENGIEANDRDILISNAGSLVDLNRLVNLMVDHVFVP